MNNVKEAADRFFIMNNWRMPTMQPDEADIINTTDAGTIIEKKLGHDYKSYYRVSNSGFVDISAEQHLQETITNIENAVAEWAVLKLAKE